MSTLRTIEEEDRPSPPPCAEGEGEEGGGEEGEEAQPEVEMSPEQYRAIRCGVGYIRSIPWPPFPQQRVGVRALSLGEMDQAYLATVDFLARHKRTGDQELHQRIERRMVLWAALRKVVWVEQRDGSLIQVVNLPEETLFSSPDHLRQNIDERQFSELWEYYDQHRATTVPLTRAQTLLREQEFDQLVALLKKKREPIELTASSYADVLALVAYLVKLAPVPLETSP